MLLTNPVLLEEPRQISSLVAWWDFSDDEQMSFGGDNINTLVDKSATGADLQFDDGRPFHAQPANSINGRPSAGFAGDLDQTMRTSADNAALHFGTGQFTIVAIFTNTDTNRSCLIHRGSADIFYHFRIHDTNDANGKAVAVTKDTVTDYCKIACDDDDYGDGDAHLLTMIRDASNFLRLYDNNVESSNSPNTDTTADLDPPTGTHYAWIGSNQAQAGIDGHWFKGQIGELLLFNDELSSDEREYLHRYLRKKWSI